MRHLMKKIETVSVLASFFFFASAAEAKQIKLLCADIKDIGRGDTHFLATIDVSRGLIFFDGSKFENIETKMKEFENENPKIPDGLVPFAKEQGLSKPYTFAITDLSYTFTRFTKQEGFVEVKSHSVDRISGEYSMGSYRRFFDDKEQKFLTDVDSVNFAKYSKCQKWKKSAQLF